MEEIKHWWGCTKYLSKLEGEEVNKLRMYYVQRCRQISNQVELPKKNFGPSVMCSHCGALWSKNNFQTRVIPGKSPSKSVKKIIDSCSGDNKLLRPQATLLKKSLKNRMNKIVIECSVCLKSTVVSCTKPKRLRPKKEEKNQADVSVLQKKKKKKVKDKTAGLNISIIQSPVVNEKKEVKHEVLKPVAIKVKKSKEKEVTPIQKVRKMNLSKLNDMLSHNDISKSRKSLSNFLKELY